MLDEIRDNPAARSLVAARGVAARLTSLGWRVRQGAVHSAGVADAAADRTWHRGELAARVQFVLRCHAGGQLLFSEGDKVEDALASYWAGDDLPEQRRALAAILETRDLDAAAILGELQRTAYPAEEAAIAPARIAAPPAAIHATAFREPRAGFEPFADLAGEAFASLDAIRNDLFAHDCEVLDGDLETLAGDPRGQSPAVHAQQALAGLARTCELLHAIVVTDAQLSVLSGGNRVIAAPAVRLHRLHLVTSDQTWIDIVHADTFDDYAESITRSYERAFAKRKFKG